MTENHAQRWIIVNGCVWTAEKDWPWEEAVVTEDEKIVYVGSSAQARKWLNSNTKVIDAAGRLVIPALLDSHTHVTSVAKTKWCFLLEKKDYRSVEEILEIVQTYTERTPKEERPYIYAYSCPTELLDRPGVDRYLMDRYVSDRPLLLCDANFHRCLVNSRMLELMEIDEHTPYRPDTSANYERYENGVPNGFIYEHAYEFNKDIDKMFEKIQWSPPSESEPEVVLPVLEAFTDWGVCGICDGFTESEGTLACMKKLERQGRLHHNYFGMPLMNDFSQLEKTIATAKDWQQRYGSDHITVDMIKFFLDGTNEIGTSAVLEPFTNDPEGKNCGVINMAEEELTTVFQRLNQESLGIQIHLVGDRAFQTALNAVEKAQKLEKEAGRAFESRISLIHCELTKPEDRERVAELGVFINFTPIWAGGVFGDEALQYLGQERFDSMYAFNRMIETGAVVNFSSDVVDNEDFADASPYIGIEAGHTRKMPGKDGPVRKRKEERLSRENMLLGYTIHNAMGLGCEDKLGSLKPGKQANLCILNQNIFEIPAEEIHRTVPDLVLFEGKVIRGKA